MIIILFLIYTFIKTTILLAVQISNPVVFAEVLDKTQITIKDYSKLKLYEV